MVLVCNKLRNFMFIVAHHFSEEFTCVIHYVVIELYKESKMVYVQEGRVKTFEGTGDED